MLMDEGDLPHCFKSPPPLALEPENHDHTLILWGEWINPETAREENPQGGPCFYANEIPEIQTYPLTGDRRFFQNAAEQKKRPRLIIRKYRIKGNGEIDSDEYRPMGEFVRCVEFDLHTEIKENQDEVHQSL